MTTYMDAATTALVVPPPWRRQVARLSRLGHSSARSTCSPTTCRCPPHPVQHTKLLVVAAAKYQIDLVDIVCVKLTVVTLFHLTVLSIHKTPTSIRPEDEPKKMSRSQGLPMLSFIALALAISTASSMHSWPMARQISLRTPPFGPHWPLPSHSNIIIGSLYCFIIDGPPPPTAAIVESLSQTNRLFGLLPKTPQRA
jgi:hypothetical protein